MARLFEGAIKEWKFVVSFMGISILFFLAEFAFQFYVLIPGEFSGSLIRAGGISAATFLGFALLSSSIFKWKPQLAKYWYVRRSLGVMGFVFLMVHFWSVVTFFFQGNPANIFFSLNPLENPIIPGFFAYIIFFLMALTSTDWAVQKLSYPLWKRLHQLVYFAYFAGVYHFTTINSEILFNAAGYLLLTITGLVLLTQLYWWAIIVSQKGMKAKGSIVGIILIVLYILLILNVIASNIGPISLFGPRYFA
jgi:DMSO/TMAO reductase YedYZ heme-binding membrane subunit